MDNWLYAFSQVEDTYVYVYQTILRYVMPLLAIVLLFRVVKPLLTFRREPEIWAWLSLENGKKLPITHWESVIGRSKRSDVVIDLPTISRNHAVLIRYDDGSWSISDAGSKSGVFVNGERIDICAVSPEDMITISGVNMKLQPISRKQEILLTQLRTKTAKPINSVINAMILTLMQVLILLSYLLTGAPERSADMFLGIGGITLLQWALLIFYLVIHKPSFELETIAFFLCTVGMAAIAATRPAEMTKQLIALVLGLCAFVGVGWAVRDLERAKSMRYLAGAIGILLLLVTDRKRHV